MSKLAFLEAVLPMVGASLKASLSHAGVGRHALLKGVAGFQLGKWVSVCVFPAVPFTRKMGGCGSVDTPLDWTWLQPSLPMQVRTQVSPLSPGVWGGESRGRSSLAFAEGGAVLHLPARERMLPGSVPAALGPRIHPRDPGSSMCL